MNKNKKIIVKVLAILIVIIVVILLILTVYKKLVYDKKNTNTANQNNETELMPLGNPNDVISITYKRDDIMGLVSTRGTTIYTITNKTHIKEFFEVFENMKKNDNSFGFGVIALTRSFDIKYEGKEIKVTTIKDADYINVNDNGNLVTYNVGSNFENKINAILKKENYDIELYFPNAISTMNINSIILTNGNKNYTIIDKNDIIKLFESMMGLQEIIDRDSVRLDSSLVYKLELKTDKESIVLNYYVDSKLITNGDNIYNTNSKFEDTFNKLSNKIS